MPGLIIQRIRVAPRRGTANLDALWETGGATRATNDTTRRESISRKHTGWRVGGGSTGARGELLLELAGEVVGEDGGVRVKLEEEESRTAMGWR